METTRVGNKIIYGHLSAFPSQIHQTKPPLSTEGQVSAISVTRMGHLCSQGIGVTADPAINSKLSPRA